MTGWCTKLAFLLTICTTVLSQDFLGSCTCDLTSNACDMNCCCDPDCSVDIKQTFSACFSTYKYENALSCDQSAVLYRNFTSYTSNTTSSNLFCVYLDRYSTRNYYASTSIDPTSETSVSTAVNTYGASTAFSSATSGVDPASLRTNYRINVPVQVLYSLGSGVLPGFLPHPRSPGGPGCSYANPALFLDSSNSSCAKQITSANCPTEPVVDLTNFVSNFRVARQPSLLSASTNYNGTDLVDISQTSIICLNASGGRVDCAGEPKPTLSGSECANLLSELKYNIQYTHGTGITAVTYDAVLRTVSVGSYLQQTFALSYNFSGSGSSDLYDRSGNPGYLTGRPLLAGQVSVNSTVGPVPNPSRWRVTLPPVSADGSCNDAEIGVTAGQTVLFGENIRATCLRSLSWNSTVKQLTTACSDVNAAIQRSLISLGSAGNIALAAFGNASSSSSGDWFRISVDSCSGVPSSTATACTGMILGGRLEILMARAGSVSNAQNKLVAARLSCEVGTIAFPCAAGSCTAATATLSRVNFLTSYTVAFIDVSDQPLEGAKQRPVYLLRLPTDFFYPLYTSGGTATTGYSLMSHCLLPLLLLASAATSSNWL